MSEKYTKDEKRDLIEVASAMIEDKRKDDEERGFITSVISLVRLRELAEAEREGRIGIGSDWTPCAEGLPENNGTYSVTVKSEFGELMILPGYFCDGKWKDYPYSKYILAWQPLPEPYNPDHIRDTTKKVKED